MPNKPAETPRRKVPPGKFIIWTDADIDEMVSPPNLLKIVEEAKMDWRENAPDRFKRLLDAEEV